MSTTEPTLSGVVSDLVPAPGTPQTALNEARNAVAAAQITGQQGVLLARLSPAEQPPATVEAAQAYADTLGKVRSSNPGLQRVVRRDFITRLPPDPRVTATAGGGQAPSATFGPFLDAFGKLTLIDTFTVPVLIAVERQGEAQPILYVEAPPFAGLSDNLKLGGGSVWMSARHLADGAPDGSFAGLRIKSGVVGFGGLVSLAGSTVPLSAAALVTLTLVLDPQQVTVGGGPGADARTAVVITPAEVTISLLPGEAKLVNATDMSLIAFGSTCGLKLTDMAPRYDTVFGRVEFPFTPSSSAFAVARSLSSLMSLSGSAEISTGAWSLAVTTAPSKLGVAAGAGGCAVTLLPGLSARWLGRDAPAECDRCVLLVEPGLLAIGGLAARAVSAVQTLPLWGNSAMRVTTPKEFGFRFVSDASGAESWAFLPEIACSFDAPRTVNNDRSRIAGTAYLELQQDAKQTHLTIEVQSVGNLQVTEQAYCLKNLLLKTTAPAVLIAKVVVSGTGAGSGVASIQSGLRFVLPILPDPYATNLAFSAESARRAGVNGIVTLQVNWQASGATGVEVFLPDGALRGISAVAPREVAPERDAAELARMDGMFAAAAGGSPAGPTLIDLSTNVSQFGVMFGSPPIAVAGPPPDGKAPVSGLFLQLPGTDVRVVTLPAVQWEPVLTPDQSPPFASPLAFADTGHPAVFGVNTITLVPVAPRQAIDALLPSISAGPKRIAVHFTLPFGITAVADVEAQGTDSLFVPSVRQVQPMFTALGLAGGDQISIRAAAAVMGAASPSLQGAAFQLHNALADGAPTETTVLGPAQTIDNTFNVSNFGPFASHPRVPVTRIDISGFGESIFSDWRNPVDAAANISKVRFDVLVGRTALEIVQAYSVLYPYAVRVVRTITIERQNSGTVVRHDSGWQAVSDGAYEYPTPAALVTHPGVVRLARSVRNIRDTGQRYTTKDGSELMAVRFDCALDIENAVRGTGPNGVPALNQLGYVQLTTAVQTQQQTQLAAAQYAGMLADVGPLGGIVDCTINIGGSGLTMRVTHVGVASSDGPDGPEFVMTAWGSPVMPGGGQWIFLRQPSGAPAPQAVDPDQGVPLVRVGAAPATPSTSPYLFADPADLLHPASPGGDYGLVHATVTQRLLFPRPKIESAAPYAITSTLAPMLADPYALGTATSPFPPSEICIPFPNSNYALAISGTGDLLLQPDGFTFTAPVLRRVLMESTAARSIAYTADETGKPSVVSLRIDTAAPEPWSVNVTNLSLATESGSLGEITRLVGTLDSTAAVPSTQMADARMIFGPALKPATAVTSFLENFGPLPPPTVTMTNDHSFQVSDLIDIQKLVEKLAGGGLIAGRLVSFIRLYVQDLDIKLSAKYQSGKLTSKFELDITFKLPTPFTVIVVDDDGYPKLEGPVFIALAKFQISILDPDSAVTLQAGGGVGVAFPILDFDALGYLAFTWIFIKGDFGWGLGGSQLGQFTVDFKVAEVDVSLETKEVFLKVNCADGSSCWGVVQVTFAMEVSIFAVIDIEVDVQAEWHHNLDGGPCPLPDVV